MTEDEIAALCGGKKAAKRVRAAAQVGEQPFGPWWEEAKRTIERDTIERCAQVAEGYRGVTGWQVEDRVAIAAAIRKLKDAP